MITFFIIVTTVILIGIVYQISKKSKTEKSIDVVDILLSEADIHTEIAKTVETIKAQDPVVIEAPFISKKVETAKPKKTVKKKMSSTKKTTTKKTTKK